MTLNVYLRSVASNTLYRLGCPQAQPSDFVVSHEFDVMAYNEAPDGQEPSVLTRFEVTTAKLKAAQLHHFSWFEVMDAYTQDLSDILSYVIDEDEEFSEEFQSIVDVPETFDIQYIANDALLDSAWGKEALSICAEHFAGQGFLVVGVSNLCQGNDPQALIAALHRCTQLEAMGFKRCGDSPFFFLDCTIPSAAYESAQEVLSQASQEVGIVARG